MKAEIILRGRTVQVAEKLAAALVKAGKATYPQKAVEPETQESEQAQAPKKRAYNRKDLRAE